MDLTVVGRHAMLFDDDASAAFINSSEALVEWNSLSIDRYDVRHLLSDLPPRKRRQSSSSSSIPHSDASISSELDHERYLDLPSSSNEDEQVMANGVVPPEAGGFRAVPFSYGNPDESNELKSIDADSGFCPPFAVPENLFKNLPPTEKVHQIIARTALFVKNHGGQSEIVLRVKQGDNPTFGFLMPDHHLHPYFRFLVDHHELLTNDANEKLTIEKDTSSGALSLLGSVYGSGEDDEDTPTQINRSEYAVDASSSHISQQSEQTKSSTTISGKPSVPTKKPVFSAKEKELNNNKQALTSSIKGRSAIKNSAASDSLSSAIDKSEPSPLPTTSKVELPILEPPSDMKRVVDKIVEFIQRNGRQFEAVLAEQDRNHGRFPFLLPSNHYHPYYISILQKAHESKLPIKGLISDEHESHGRGMDKKSLSLKSTELDIPCDYERKDKFKMVIPKSKKDGLDVPSKPTLPPVEVTVDAAAAAAILQAATRGIKTSLIEIGHTSSFGTLHSSQPGPSMVRTSESGPNDADSSESHLTREQNLKAKRLKRAKMFATMIKGGAVPLKTEPSRRPSIEPPGSGTSASVAEAIDLDQKNFSDLNNDRRSKRRYRSRADREDNDIEESEEEEEEKKREHKHRKKHGSRRSSHKHRKRYGSKHRSPSDDNPDHSKSRRRSKNTIHEKQSKHESSSEDERRNSRSKHKNRGHSSDESRIIKQKRFHSIELEEGEITMKLNPSKASEIDTGRRESSKSFAEFNHGVRASSEPSKPVEAPDDLKAKIRAMLLATM